MRFQDGSVPHSSLADPAAATLAIVLAGGNGSRLKDLTRWECKPALPFGGKFRNIDFSLCNCLHSGVRRIAVLTQYRSQTLIHHLEEAWSFLPRELGEFVDLWPAQQRTAQEWYSGTANAVFQNLDLIRNMTPRMILVLAGDHVYKMDYRSMLRRHLQSGAEVTVSCVPVAAEEAAGLGVLQASEDGQVTNFLEKPALSELGANPGDSLLCSMGVYVFNAEYLYEQLARDAGRKDSSHDFGRDLIPAAVSAGKARAFVFADTQGRPGYWRDVGTLDAYWKAHMELHDPLIDFNVSDPSWPIYTRARQLPPAQLLSQFGPCAIIDSIISEGCVLDSATVARSVIGPGVHIGAESALEEAVVLPDARIGAHCRLRRAIIEQGCIVPPGSVIGHNEVADAERFTLSNGGVVLVTAEALSRETLQVA